MFSPEFFVVQEKQVSSRGLHFTKKSVFSRALPFSTKSFFLPKS